MELKIMRMPYSNMVEHESPPLKYPVYEDPLEHKERLTLRYVIPPFLPPGSVSLSLPIIMLRAEARLLSSINNRLSLLTISRSTDH